MPTLNHASAILRWWEQVENDGGIGAITQSATVSTMLFGCHRWLEAHADQAPDTEVAEIRRVKAALENWMTERGKTFEG